MTSLTPIKDRAGKLYFIEITSGCEGNINIIIKRKPKQRNSEYMTFWQFVKWAKKKRIRGLPYEELFGPNAEQYGRPAFCGLAKE